LISFFVLAAAALEPPTAANPIDARRPDKSPPTLAAPGEPPPRPARRARTAQCKAPITAIRFRGPGAPAPVAEAAEAFVGKTCSADLLIELTNALSAAYERSNVALYTVAIPNQDFADGVVLVDLVEGWVDEVRIEGRATPLLRKRAEALIGVTPLTRGALERQSALIQAIPGLTVESSIANAQADDSVTLVLKPQRKKAEFALGINNRGSRILGQSIVQGGFDLYSTLFDGDQVSGSAYATPNLKNFRAFDLGYAVPLTASGLALAISGGQLRTRARKADIRGKATFAALSLSYPLVRRDRLALDVAVSLDGVNSDNALFGSVFTTERTRALRVVGSVAANLGRSEVRGAVIVSKGLGIFGARTGGSDNETGFFKLNLFGEVQHRFTDRLIGRTTMLAQWSGDRLPGSELMSVGGPVIGRGFDTGFLSTDRGAGGLAELAWRPLDGERFEASELYAFIDGAHVTLNRRLASPRQSFDLASAGLGARVKFRDRMELGIEAAKILEKPSFYGKSSRFSVYYAIQF
jgi:hemolysin activation/secretion protein